MTALTLALSPPNHALSQGATPNSPSSPPTPTLQLCSASHSSYSMPAVYQDVQNRTHRSPKTCPPSSLPHKCAHSHTYPDTQTSAGEHPGTPPAPHRLLCLHPQGTVSSPFPTLSSITFSTRANTPDLALEAQSDQPLPPSPRFPQLCSSQQEDGAAPKHSTSTLPSRPQPVPCCSLGLGGRGHPSSFHSSFKA